MYAPSFTARTFYVDNAQLEADLSRWESQHAHRQIQCEEDWNQLKNQRQIKKTFQHAMMSARDMNAKATFAPTYRDIRTDQLVLQSYAEVVQGELDYPGMSDLLAQLLMQQVKAGNRLAQRILVKASQTFSRSNIKKHTSSNAPSE